MTSRIEWVGGQCRLLATIADEFDGTRPFEGLTIGTGIHLEAVARGDRPAPSA